MARTLPNSGSRDIWVAAAPNSGVFVFRSVDAGMAPRSNFIGFEIPGSVLGGKVLEDLVATIPREAGQPELTFAMGPSAKLEPDAGSEFGAAIPGLKLAAGYRGTTIAALARKQFWMHLGMIALVLGSIAFGLIFTLRGVQRESRAAAVKTAFLAHVSHEMKTPLAAIHLYAETLEMGRISDPAKQEQYLKRIREEAQHMAAMVNDVLEFSRMADGKRHYRILPEDPNSIAEKAAQACEQTSHIPVRLESDPDLPAVACDQGAIRQALGNLLSNAVKYRGQSGEVGLRLERQNGHVLFRVTDRGIGIPADEQSQIFERFYRADDDRVRATPGNGLGLSIARDIVTAHGGEIQVASEPGQGSTFTIALPAAAGS
jgi:signal transduction histidine kinase